MTSRVTVDPGAHSLIVRQVHTELAPGSPENPAADLLVAGTEPKVYWIYGDLELRIKEYDP